MTDERHRHPTDASRDKRRLEIMPEVLPAPTAERVTSSVRGRTLAHAQYLMAAVAAVASSDCSRESQPPSLARSGDRRDSGPIFTTGNAGAGGATTPPTATPDQGYAVVDPMPMPALCRGAAPTANTRVKVSRDHDKGDLIVELVVELGRRDAAAGTRFDVARPPVTTEPLLATNIVADKATVRWRHRTGPSEATYGQATFVMDCAAGTSSLVATVTYPTPLDEHGSPTVQLAEW
jgi:hypothetical protein